MNKHVCLRVFLGSCSQCSVERLRGLVRTGGGLCGAASTVILMIGYIRATGEALPFTKEVPQEEGIRFVFPRKQGSQRLVEFDQGTSLWLTNRNKLKRPQKGWCFWDILYDILYYRCETFCEAECSKFHDKWSTAWGDWLSGNGTTHFAEYSPVAMSKVWKLPTAVILIWNSLLVPIACHTVKSVVICTHTEWGH